LLDNNLDICLHNNNYNMSAQIKIFHAYDLISATPQGQLNLETFRNLLLEISLTSNTLQKCNLIIDTRKTHSIMSVFDLWHIASELNELTRNFVYKTAILYIPIDFNNIDFFTLCSKNRGSNIKAFTSYEEAMEWLFDA